MTDLERKTLAINGIAENYGKELSAELLKMWLRLLASYTPEQVEAGAVHVIGSYVYKTMPPFAILREAIDEAAGAGPRATEMQAAAEWARLQRDIPRYGTYARPETLASHHGPRSGRHGGMESRLPLGNSPLGLQA